MGRRWVLGNRRIADYRNHCNDDCGIIWQPERLIGMNRTGAIDCLKVNRHDRILAGPAPCDYMVAQSRNLYRDTPDLPRFG